MADIPFPEPDAVIARLNYWQKRTIRKYRAQLMGLPEPEHRSDDEVLINTKQVRDLFGGVSAMWLWRKRQRKGGADASAA